MATLASLRSHVPLEYCWRTQGLDKQTAFIQAPGNASNKSRFSAACLNACVMALQLAEELIPVSTLNTDVAVCAEYWQDDRCFVP